MASELSELRAELWRTRDDLERMKSRTPPNVDRPSGRVFDRRRDADGRKADRDHGGQTWQNHGRLSGEKIDRGGVSDGGGGGGGGVRSGPTSPPTSGESSGWEANDRVRSVHRGERSGRKIGVVGVGSDEEVAAEETLWNLELEGAAFQNWTEEASSIAVRLIEEVKTLRWERATWADREAAAERAAVELRARAEALEKRVHAAESDGRRSQEALSRAKLAERELVEASERAKADLRAAQERETELRAQVVGLMKGTGGTLGGGGGLREELQREKEGADALQRRLDAARAVAARLERERKEWRVSKEKMEALQGGLEGARAAAARHERERKEWRVSTARLEELRRSWGKQLRKVEKKMRFMARENAALQTKVADAVRARDLADADASRHREELRRLTEQRDNLLLGATRAGHLSASCPADALAELLAAAAAGVVAGAAGAGDGMGATVYGPTTPARGVGDGRADSGSSGGGIENRAEELEAELEQARSEAKLARVAAQQERLKREGAARDKDEAVRQLHRLMGAARRAMGRRETRLRSSRLETEVVWNALTEAVR